jgi:hypothetical protein
MKLREKSMKGRQLEKRENLFVIDKNQLLYLKAFKFFS